METSLDQPLEVVERMHHYVARLPQSVPVKEMKAGAEAVRAAIVRERRTGQST
jgi:hypothetical protein